MLERLLRGGALTDDIGAGHISLVQHLDQVGVALEGAILRAGGGASWVGRGSCRDACPPPPAAPIDLHTSSCHLQEIKGVRGRSEGVGFGPAKARASGGAVARTNEELASHGVCLRCSGVVGDAKGEEEGNGRGPPVISGCGRMMRRSAWSGECIRQRGVPEQRKTTAAAMQRLWQQRRRRHRCGCPSSTTPSACARASGARDSSGGTVAGAQTVWSRMDGSDGTDRHCRPQMPHSWYQQPPRLHTWL